MSHGPDRAGEVLNRLHGLQGVMLTGTYWLSRSTSSAETPGATGSARRPSAAAVCGVALEARRGASGGGGTTAGEDFTFLSLPTGTGRGGVGTEPGRGDGVVGSGPPRSAGTAGGGGGRQGLDGSGGGGAGGRVASDGDSGDDEGGSTSVGVVDVLVVGQVRRTAGTGDRRGDGVGLTDVTAGCRFCC